MSELGETIRQHAASVRREAAPTRCTWGPEEAREHESELCGIRYDPMAPAWLIAQSLLPWKSTSVGYSYYQGPP